MRVVKYSIDPKEWKLVVTCAHCQSQVELETEDVIYEELHSEDSYSTYYYCQCGACKERINLKDKDLPNIISSYARNKNKNK